MASLALLASLVFLSVLIIGPMIYILSLFAWMPDLIINILAVICIGIGVWWLLLPLPMIRYYGLVNVLIGYKVIASRYKKTTQG